MDTPNHKCTLKLKTSFVENSLEMGNLPIMMLKIRVKESKEHLFSKGK